MKTPMKNALLTELFLKENPITPDSITQYLTDFSCCQDFSMIILIDRIY